MKRIIMGKLGRIEIEHWHIGDDIRITVYEKDGNSVYFVTNSRGAMDWIKGLQQKENGSTVKLQQDRAVAEILRVGDLFMVEGYDIYSPGSRSKAFFDLDQAQQIMNFLRKSEYVQERERHASP